MEYYDSIASGYDELHEEEQLRKLAIIKKELMINAKTKLLDVGCGTGISSGFDCNVVGVDPSSELLKIARKKHPGVTFIHASAEHLPFPDHSFDVVVSLTAVQNFNDIEKGLNEIKRVGKKQFALSYLKRSEKVKKIEKMIKKIFSSMKRIEEEKDIIFIINSV